MKLTDLAISELIKYNLLEEVNNLINTDTIIKIDVDDINSIINSEIKGYFCGECNNNADFIINRVSKDTATSSILFITQRDMNLSLYEQTMNRIRTEFGEDINIIFGVNDSLDDNIKILFIAC